ncbi:MAG: LysM peptidoglycan-binding domain-containing protein [Clostridiales bacterium]|nr:LysM peptidoglycan-binding domain-containing protein [Clostridiales bacterium]
MRNDRDKGDTLDFYNSDMPKTAVKSLVAGFEKDEPRALPPEAPYDDEPAEAAPPGSREAWRERSNTAGIPETEGSIEEYISLYRQGERRQARRRMLGDERAYDSAVRKRQDAEDYDEDYGIDPERPKPPRPRPAPMKPAPPKKRRFDDYDEPAAAEGSPLGSAAKIAAGIIVVLVLASMAALITQINKVNKENEELRKAAENSKTASDDLQKLSIEASGYQQRIAELEKLVEESKSGEAPVVGSDGSETPPAEPPGGQSHSGSDASGKKSYTVAQGDTLSKISSKFYGTSGKYQDIMTANGLTSDVVQPGQTLVIP